jgi:hypothetical protein
MKRDRLDEIEDIGFYVVMMFASIVIGSRIIGMVANLFGYE